MHLLKLIAISSFALVPVCSLSAAPVSAIYAFGDSLSDTGNAYWLSGGVFPGANYAPMEFTDGPNTTPATHGAQGLWVDQLAPKLGVADPKAFYTPITSGTDFAVASAHAIPDQLASVPAELAIFAGSAGKTGAPASGLYTFWAGANDIFDAIGTGESTTVGKTAADDLAAGIGSLIATGGKNFLWLNLPPLGETPFGLASGQTAYLNGQASAFNSEWALQLAKLNQASAVDPGLKVTGVDVNSIFQQVAANYAAGCTVAASNPYCFSNITTPAQGQAGVNPDTYLYWDSVHPTTAADTLIADAAAADLGLAPEPQTIGMALGGFLLLGAYALRQKRQQLSHPKKSSIIE